MLPNICEFLFMNLMLLFACASVGPVQLPVFGIGIICDSSSCTELVPSTHITSHNVTLQWSLVDTQEIFQVMNSVQRFDRQDNISVIMILEFHAVLLDFPHVLRTKKPLLYWGSMDFQQNQVEPSSSESTNDVCTQHDHFGGMYCKHYNDDIREPKPTFQLAGLVLKLIVRLRWEHVTILHDNETQFKVARIIDRLSMAGILSIVYNVDSLHHLNDTLYAIYRKDITMDRRMKFVTVCRSTCTKTILNTASTFAYRKETTLFAQFSRWLSVVIDGNQAVQNTLCRSASGLDNFATIIIPKGRSATAKDFLQLLDVTLLDLFRNSSGNHGNLTYPDSLISSLTEASRAMDSTYTCSGYFIDTLLWSKNGRVFNTVGSVSDKYVSVTTDIFPNTNYGYNKKEFIVSTLPYAPFVMKTMVNGTPEYSGLSIDLLREMAATLNFTYRLIEPVDKNWGTYISRENKTFNGLIGQLQRKECDFVFTVISIQKERTHACDFSYPYFYQFTTVALKRADARQNKWRTLIDPFHWLVHIAIGIALVLTTCIIFVVERYNPYYGYHEKQTGSLETDRLDHLHNAFWYMYGALLSQGGVHLPNSVAGRTFVSCWALFSLVMVGTYCGNLIATLTVTKETLPFNTLKEMAAMRDNYRWGTLGGSFWEVVFTTSTIPVYKEIGDKMIEFNRSDPDTFNRDPDFHLRRVKEGGYAWIGDKTYIERMTATDCELVRIKEEVFPWLIAVGLVKNSPHTRIFDNAIMKIHESGLLELWKRKWWPKSNICKKDTIPEAKPISLTDVQSAFYVCCAGVCISVTAFVCELFVYHVRKRKKENGVTINEESLQNGVSENSSSDTQL